MKTNRTLDEIRREGLIALRARLGVAGMVRFLQQFELGGGDYVKQRRKWIAQSNLGDIRKLLARTPARKSRKAG